MANVSPIGLSARKRVDDMDGRRGVVPESSAFAASNGFEKTRRPARRLFRTWSGNFMDASNHGLYGFLGQFTVQFCCYYRCSLLRVLRDVVIHEVPIEMLAPRCGTCGSPARGLRRSRAASRVFGRRRAFRATLTEYLVWAQRRSARPLGAWASAGASSARRAKGLLCGPGAVGLSTKSTSSTSFFGFRRGPSLRLHLLRRRPPACQACTETFRERVIPAVLTE